jgi:hypothetical protein
MVDGYEMSFSQMAMAHTPFMQIYACFPVSLTVLLPELNMSSLTPCLSVEMYVVISRNLRIYMLKCT